MSRCTSSKQDGRDQPCRDSDGRIHEFLLSACAIRRHATRANTRRQFRKRLSAKISRRGWASSLGSGQKHHDACMKSGGRLRWRSPADMSGSQNGRSALTVRQNCGRDHRSQWRIGDGIDSRERPLLHGWHLDDLAAVGVRPFNVIGGCLVGRIRTARVGRQNAHRFAVEVLSARLCEAEHQRKHGHDRYDNTRYAPHSFRRSCLPVTRHVRRAYHGARPAACLPVRGRSIQYEIGAVVFTDSKAKTLM